MPTLSMPSSGWLPRPTPKVNAAPISHRSARGDPLRRAANQTSRSQITAAVKSTLIACTSARVAFSQGSAANAKAAPATPADVAARPRWRASTRCPAMRTTRPDASATDTPESRFIRHATSPIGRAWVHSQPSSVKVGNPVGWKIDSVAGTVCASPVSQNPVAGSMVRR
jgi:hypothetical protein